VTREQPKRFVATHEMVSLGGTSLSAVIAFNDDELLYGDQTRIVTAHDREVHSTYPRIGKHNLMVGKFHSAGAESANNLVIGEGVIVENGVKNSASIGRNNVVIRESNKFDIGGFITITDGVFLSAMRGAVTASEDGTVVLGGALRVENGAVDFAGTVQIGGAEGWTLGLQDSEALGKYDLAMRSATGTAVVFCNDFVPAVMNFTGQHRCVMFGEAPPAGSVLVATGAFDCPDSDAIDVDEAIPVVAVSDRAMDKRAFGVLSKVEAKRGLTRRIQVGNLCFIRPRKRAASGGWSSTGAARARSACVVKAAVSRSAICCARRAYPVSPCGRPTTSSKTTRAQRPRARTRSAIRRMRR
jgi:hypothetical protein